MLLARSRFKAATEIHINVIVRLRVELLLELFAKRAVHGKVVAL